MGVSRGSRRLLLVLTLVLVVTSSLTVLGANKVTIKFFSNLPDRTAGQGRLEQLLIENYIKANPGVEVKVEALQDEPYKQKFRVYTAGNQLPDLFMVWGQPAFFDPIMKGGYAAELNKNDYKDYGFFEGALDGFSMNGKLYGLARNTDLMVLYYNEKIFKDHKVKVPTTYDELVTAIKAFRKAGITPIAQNGRDCWVLNILYQDLVMKESGDPTLIYQALDQKVKFADHKHLLAAAQDLQALINLGIFQDSFVAADYGAARNLFGQEQAAMYYMGAWETGLAADENFSASFRNNVSVVPFPGMVGKGKGQATDLMGWFGGGYAVSASSPVKAEAIKLLNYIMAPENWAKNAWQLGLVIPGQKYDQFMTGQENKLQIQISEIINQSTSFSGTPWNDAATPGFKVDSETLIQEFAAGMKTPQEFLRACDQAAQKALK